ncbi:MAG: M15 family metallopeptidase [Lachnospiraceae bacterium]|nr:M15 family metallopeptidase [Lachnospiraceae bacterium]
MNNQYIRQILKPLFSILAIIIVCSFLVRILTDSETLSDYAAKNPELAYGDSASHIDEDKEAEQKESEMGTNNTNNEGLNSKENVANNNAAQDSTNDTEIQDSSPEENIAEASSSAPDRIVYKEGFYYEPLNEDIKTRITGISYPVSESEASAMEIPVFNTLEDDAVPAISYEDLSYLSVLYYDFNGEVQSGELICNKGIANDLAEIFYELYMNEYQIEKIRLVDEYDADDTASITDNNTSCFNYRVVDGTTTLSKHALGCAIDINPFYNPYVVYNKDGSGETYISPPGSEIYVDRSKDFPYKIDENDLCYKLFKAHGFTWGGVWNSCKDYQHFQKVID